MVDQENLFTVTCGNCAYFEKPARPNEVCGECTAELPRFDEKNVPIAYRTTYCNPSRPPVTVSPDEDASNCAVFSFVGSLE